MDYENGEVMYAVNGTKGTVTERVVEMNGNPMKTGASGGAWIIDISDNGGARNNLIVGLNAGSIADEPVYQSPIFSHDTIYLYYQVIDESESEHFICPKYRGCKKIEE